ncbi:MAG: molecular chaperone TorD family protein [Gammaproteobacteria bacterium]|uniref:TorD/DmsD family molecular chaperone n=1 Tax=Hydrogenophaga sp. TaxID=1904254 RepID=UPI0025B85E59|nr:molecular chaperone TorD family protein [Hydrogenophaga sp.]MBU4181803.1 molecular chaperone TorD family protein [Gammaproteobacteria bacterium]MBU4280205.1 molecular chaperone TorD family protein [Gammaproteobacteria bacterium]MBU4322291.1 molecular chaperone TorD family protein [Gammaproteobacteria bacterium]MBU4508701.1 molecular chaperone TorD family protein [Gammaproteobacteria bacterium]MCG2657339.1 molecular chaperone TorD family protein [Hydrogenophaga sp.]
MNDQIPVSSALDEEAARAEVYGLLAALFYAPPSPDLLAQLRVAVTEAPAAGGFLEEPWRQFVGTVRELSDAEVAAEYNALFGGVGKPELYLFGSWYLSGFLNEKPLAALRGDLATLGLARDESMNETEDHFACVCEVMRYLIAGDDVEVANLTQQQKFFSAHVQSWAPALCEAITAHPKARFYAALAGFTVAFISVETQAFDLMV